ncbi:hypothetical protein B7463_g11656, partial [Scytalidium lignicola]
MANDSGTVVLPKDQRLKGSENYDLWSSCLMVLLWSKGLEDHVEDIVDESISVINSSGVVMYNKNNSNSSNLKGFKDVKYNYYKKNGHKESDYFQKYPEKLEEYKAKWFNKKKKKKSKDKPKKSDSKDKSNIVNLNFTNLVITSLVIANLTTFFIFTHNQ